MQYIFPQRVPEVVRRAEWKDVDCGPFDELAKQLVFPSGYQNPIAKSHYHLVVVGAGPAGLIASISAAGLGARVALARPRGA